MFLHVPLPREDPRAWLISLVRDPSTVKGEEKIEKFFDKIRTFIFLGTWPHVFCLVVICIHCHHWSGLGNLQVIDFFFRFLANFDETQALLAY